VQVWPFTENKFGKQHCLTAFKPKNIYSGLNSEARQLPLIHVLKQLVIRHTKEVLDLPRKIVKDVPGESPGYTTCEQFFTKHGDGLGCWWCPTLFAKSGHLV
jgi:hypothetical protein